MTESSAVPAKKSLEVTSSLDSLGSIIGSLNGGMLAKDFPGFRARPS